MTKPRVGILFASFIVAVGLTGLLAGNSVAKPYSGQATVMPPETVTVLDEQAAEILRKAYDASRQIGSLCKMDGRDKNMTAFAANSKKCMCKNFDLFVLPFKYRKAAIADILSRRPELKNRPFVITGTGIQPHFISTEDQKTESDASFNSKFECQSESQRP